MDYKLYHEAVGRMQEMGVSREYMLGWIGGYMHNPKLEEQRVTEAYEAGYEDGENGNTSNFERWVNGK